MGRKRSVEGKSVDTGEGDEVKNKRKRKQIGDRDQKRKETNEKEK